MTKIYLAIARDNTNEIRGFAMREDAVRSLFGMFKVFNPDIPRDGLDEIRKNMESVGYFFLSKGDEGNYRYQIEELEIN